MDESSDDLGKSSSKKELLKKFVKLQNFKAEGNIDKTLLRGIFTADIHSADDQTKSHNRTDIVT